MVHTLFSKYTGTFNVHTGIVISQKGAPQESCLHKCIYIFISGLCSRGTWVPQVTTFCLRATGKTYFSYIHVNISAHADHPRFHD